MSSALSRRVLLCTTAAVTSAGLLFGTAGPAAAEAAVKAPLIHNPNNNCQLGADALPGGTATSSFALVVHTSAGVNATVVLQDGRPNVTYTVYLIQTAGVPSGDPMDCYTPDATLTTNNAGKGTALIREALLPGAAYVHAYLYTVQGGFDDFDTHLVPVT